MENVPVPQTAVALAGAAVVLTLLYFRYMKSTNRYALPLVALPVAILSVFPAWLTGFVRVINGFRGMALSESGGVERVIDIVLDANRGAAWGHVASLPPLIVLLILGAILLRQKWVPPSRLAPTWVSALLMATATLCVLGMGAVAEMGTRTIFLPLPLIVPVEALEDTNAPKMLRAKDALDLDNATIGTVVAYISNSLAISATACFIMFFAALLFLALNWAVSISVSFPRSVLIVGVTLTFIATAATVTQLYHHAAITNEIAYLVGTYIRE